MIALFGQFYISNYSRKSKEKKAAKEAKSK